MLVQVCADLTIGYDPNAPKDSYEGPTPDHDAFGVGPSASSGYLTTYGQASAHGAAAATGYSTGGGYQQPQQDYSAGLTHNAASSSSSSFASSTLTAQQQQQYQASGSTLPPIITKSFYFEAAPEEPEEEQKPRFVTVGRAQKNYKVIFIKAPTYGLNSQIIPIVPPNEDKTIIYVLSKKPEQNENIELPPTPTTEAIKPDVFFIKYKSEQEAHDAQHKIQSVYETSSDDAQSDVAHLQSIANAAVPNIVSSNAAGRLAATVGQTAPVHFGYRGSFEETNQGEGVVAEQPAEIAAPSVGDSNSEQSVSGYTVLSGHQQQTSDEGIFVDTTQAQAINDQASRGIFSAVATAGGAHDSSVSVNFVSTGTATTGDETVIGVEPEYLPPNDQN